jgi:CRP/FNR family transcriptional regulator
MRTLRATLGKRPSRAELEALAECGEVIIYRPGDKVFDEGEPSRYVHIVLRGIVEVSRKKGRERIISRPGSGRFLGNTSMFLNVPYQASAYVATYCEIYWFDRRKLMPLLESSPNLCMAFLIAAMQELADTHDQIELMLGRTARQQVAGLLVEHSDEDGHVEMSQTTMAAMLGVRRQTINRSLSELAELGLLETGYRHIRVLNIPGLREEVDRLDEE